MIKITSAKTIVMTSVSLFLLSGCMNDEPSFNPNNKRMVAIAGKPYRVPLETNYSTQPFQSATDNGVIKGREAGLDCRKGDIFWISTEAQEAARRASLDGDTQRAASIIIAAPRKKQIGCAHPLSKKEFEYYKAKQKK